MRGLARKTHLPTAATIRREHPEGFASVPPASDGQLQENISEPHASPAEHNERYPTAHLVQFYETDSALMATLGDFVAQGLAAGDVCIVVATPTHRNALDRHLQDQGIDLNAASMQNRYLSLDAQATLSQFMIDGVPDPVLFTNAMRGVLSQVATSHFPVRIFGEMVAILWAQGNHAAATQLEDLWNELHTVAPFTLLCAYPKSNFAGGIYEGLYAHICKQHTHVLPAEHDVTATNEGDRLQAMQELQQQARILTAEILERQTVEERLRVSENRYRQLFETATDGIIIVDQLTHRIVETNPAAATLFDMPQEHMLGQTPWQVGLFRDEEAYLAAVQSLRHRKTIQFPSLMIPAGNGQRSVEMVCALSSVNHHQMLQCTLRDNTERNQWESTRLLLAAIVESSDDAILSKDLNGIITSWNAAAERMYGYSADEMIGHSIERIYPSERQSEFERIMDHIRNGERVDHFETIRMRRDGKRLTVSVTVSPIKDNAGTIIGASDIMRDITERKLLEAKVHHLFTSNLIGVFVSDFAGTFLEANDAFLDLVGYTREELQAGRLQRDAMTPPEYHSLSQQAIEAMRAQGASGTYEGVYVHKTGESIPVLIAVTRIDDSDTCIGFVLDIRERKELEQRKDTFISMAGHELKTPLTSMKTSIGLLQRRLRSQTDERVQTLLAGMDTQVNRLTRLINDLLDLSKIQVGQLVYRQERFAFDALVQEIVEMLQESIHTHQIHLTGRADAEVMADRDRVGQVLTNLINNAVKYSPQAKSIEVQVTSDAEQVRASIRDYGVGIALDQQQRVFERFYQVGENVEATSISGLGLGLFLSREIITYHGGRIWVESQPGQGSTFSFTLPRASATGD
jgi:PAS domain S-box-containing protein